MWEQACFRSLVLPDETVINMFDSSRVEGRKRPNVTRIVVAAGEIRSDLASYSPFDRFPLLAGGDLSPVCDVINPNT